MCVHLCHRLLAYCTRSRWFTDLASLVAIGAVGEAFDVRRRRLERPVHRLVREVQKKRFCRGLRDIILIDDLHCTCGHYKSGVCVVHFECLRRGERREERREERGEKGAEKRRGEKEVVL